LGGDCYIGSDAEPIVTLPASLAPPEVEFLNFDPNGTPDQEQGTMLDIKSFGSQGSSSFAVPAASGCGYDGFFDQAVDNNVGLPSAASTNSLTFNEGTSHLMGISNSEAVAPNDGKEFAKDWHSAVLPSEDGDRHGSNRGNQRVAHNLSLGAVKAKLARWFRH
jgi:hypothetical protein